MNENINTSDTETNSIMNIDFSPFNYEEIKKNIVHSVNVRIGIKDGGNTNIAQGKILYPDDFEKRKLAVLSFTNYDD